MKDRLKRLLAYRFRISTQMYLGIGGAVLLTIAATLVGLFSFSQVSRYQNTVNEQSVPNLVAAFGVAQHGNSLVAAAPRLTTVQTYEELSSVADEINGVRRLFQQQLDALEQQTGGFDERFESIRSGADTLVNNILLIRYNTSDLLDLRQQRSALATQLSELSANLDAIVIPALDDQLFYTMTGYETLGESPAPRTEYFAEDELLFYRRLAELQGDAGEATQHLSDAFTVADASLIEPLRERFESAKGRIDRNMAALRGTDFHEEITPIIDQIIQVGTGQQNGFDLLDRELTLVEQQRDLLVFNRDQGVTLVAAVDGLVSEARAGSQEATLASSQAILTGRNLLLAISVISIGGAVLISWLYIGRVLLRRLALLSSWMRRMAGGDLESRVEIGGRDEVADMASALDVFRRHALEVQRLNLVEQLAEELQGKNDQLESVLADLRRAQDQIVVREKLAALGELTAGVAHEIRNPLNFIKNFSESSEELLVELKEILEEDSGDQSSLIEEISGDLVDNLGRIRSHGERANRIVHDMLMMGRGAGDWQPTNINNLLDEHARLAYHSARALDPDFNLDLKQDFDEAVGEVEVVPQDLARVFLNMVSNAGYATDQKRKSGAAGTDGEPYFPTLWLTTRRLDDCIEVQIKDNGSGIPDHIVDEIFNPFFTTKPTGEGTGLGLAMSNDIIRQHGGSISVETEPGQFTAMTIQLPLEPPSAAAESQTEGEPELSAEPGRLV